MKKLGILALAALMVVAFAMPASALENTFGGYWDSRMFNINDTDGNDATADDDDAWTTSRLRLYYTAGLNDNLKIVTKFEIDYVWGGQVNEKIAAGGSAGALGADAVGEIELKNVYADYNLGPVNVKMGTQGTALARGFMWDMDATGVVLSYSPMDMVTIPFIWVKGYEAAAAANGEDQDFDIYGIAPVFKIGEGISLQPMIVKAATDDVSGIAFPTGVAGELDAWYYGIDASATFGPLSVYGLFIQQSGDYDPAAGGASTDLSGNMFDFGVGYDFGMFSLRGEFISMSGDDNVADNDFEAWTSTPGESLNKGELLMDNGILFGNSSVSPYGGGTPAQNTFAGANNGMVLWNLGASVKPIDKLTLALDYYNADYAETAAGVDEEIGSEIDFVATYELIEGLKLDVLACFYQVGEDVVAGTTDEDQTLYGARFSVAW